MAVGQVNRKSSGGEGVSQVNSDWDASTGVEEILHKPTIVSPVNSDWDADIGLPKILNKPTIVSPVNADWNAGSGLAEIQNKPTIPAAQVKSDWNASGTIAEVLNKPTMLYANAIFTKPTVVDGEFLWPYGIFSGTSTVEYNNYYPLPRGKNFIIRNFSNKVIFFMPRL